MLNSTGISLHLRIVVLLASLAAGCISCKRTAPNTSPDQRVASHYERRTKNSRVIVFVHGIFGNAVSTWTCPRLNVYWPRLILTDNAFSNSDIYVLAYDSPSVSGQMNVDEIVSNVDNRLVNDAVFSHQEVIFVCHSLGGLIVQRLLLTHQKYALQVPMIFFYSTPEEGSELARLGAMFSADPLLKAMFPGDANNYLQNLENEWIGAQFNIKRYCAYEKKPTHGYSVVTRLSATRNCTAGVPVPINEDHSGMVKPCSSQDDSYVALRNAIRETPSRTSHTEKRSTTRAQPFHEIIQDEDGGPLQEVELIVPDIGIRVLTDIFGRFSFTVPVDSGTHFRLIIEKSGYEVRTADPIAGNLPFNCSLRRAPH